MRHPVGLLIVMVLWSALVGCASRPAHTGIEPPAVATFSIVARDPATGELGIAVASRFLAVGAVVPWARAGVGAVATQSFANTGYGPRGLELLAAGNSPAEALAQLTEADGGRDRRQVGIVAADGRAATFTGNKCQAWAGGHHDTNYAVQGNILAGENVVRAMATVFERRQARKDGKRDLGDDLLAALRAGQEAGGDQRGRQSAALLIVKERGGYGGFNDRYCDLRVDDHPQPIAELLRIYQLHKKLRRR